MLEFIICHAEGWINIFCYPITVCKGFVRADRQLFLRFKHLMEAVFCLLSGTAPSSIVKSGLRTRGDQVSFKGCLPLKKLTL